jgi:hypothetical protein
MGNHDSYSDSRSPASALAARRAALCFHHRATFFRAALSPETGGPARRFLDARRGALHGRDERSVRRSRWRARAGGASATTYGAVKEEAVSLGGAENGETVRGFSAE